jgi:predicted amidohydrolase YtcJ
MTTDENRLSRRQFLKTGSMAVLGGTLGGCLMPATAPDKKAADLIVYNGKITTLDPRYPNAQNAAIKDGRIIGVDDAEAYQRGPNTRVIDLKGRRVIPGLNDSHLHVIRGGLNYNMELRWDGVPSLADALRMLKEQAQRTPAGQWVRVVGGWSEFQFAEKRMPTLAEVNAVAPDTPVFILHLYCRALLNQAALRACGYTKDTPNPPGGEIQRDTKGHPTGLLIARPSATILYATLAKGPKLPPEHQVNSTRHFMRELNRLGLTSIIDAGGGYQNYPEDYAVIEQLHKQGELTLRIAYNLFTQKPKQEKEDFARWIKMTGPGRGDDFLRCNGAGEMLVFSAADFEDFLEPRPDLASSLEAELKDVVALLAANKWPFRLHATYDESITRFLNVFEEVNRRIPFQGLNWFFDHCETISDRNLDRVKALGGGIAVQHRMAYQGEYFMARYGKKAAQQTPPIRKMLQGGIPVGAGTDATRVASYNPWVSLYWLVTGNTVGGTSMYPETNRLSREEALRLFTQGSSWFSSEGGKKGAIAPGQLADLAALTDDYFSVPDEQIKRLESVLTIVGGRIVHATEEFVPHAPPPIPVLPEWSPMKVFGGYGAPLNFRKAATAGVPVPHQLATGIESRRHFGFFGSGCDCFAF